MKNTFKKEERLCSKTKIQELFQRGNSFSVFPFRLVYIKVDSEQEFPAQITFSVPKKKFKSAVDRNHLKRLMREAYRINKSILYDNLTKESVKIAVLVIYLPRHKEEYKEIEDKIILSLQRLNKEISSPSKKG